MVTHLFSIYPRLLSYMVVLRRWFLQSGKPKLGYDSKKALVALGGILVGGFGCHGVDLLFEPPLDVFVQELVLALLFDHLHALLAQLAHTAENGDSQR